LNQLPEETVLPVKLDVVWERNHRSSAPLGDFRKNVNAGRIDSATAPRAFEMVYVANLAGRFAGTKSFVPALEEVLAAFHEHIARHIHPWQGRAISDEGSEPETLAEPVEAPPAIEPERKVAQRGEIEGKAYSIFEDGSIEVETGQGIQRFNSFAELSAAAAARNGHARLG
jgi:hypothetical protein